MSFVVAPFTLKACAGDARVCSSTVPLAVDEITYHEKQESTASKRKRKTAARNGEHAKDPSTLIVACAQIRRQLRSVVKPS
jgi:hypothetical protein